MPRKISPKTDPVTRAYDRALPLYQLAWSLGKTQSIHYGYWDKSVKNLPQALHRLDEELALFGEIPKESIVLDAGCGTGGSMAFLVKNYQTEIVGVTLSEKQIEKGEKVYADLISGGRLLFCHADYLNVPLPDGQFDVVWAVESIFHTPDKEKFYAEANRLLRTGGLLLMADYFLSERDFSEKESQWLAQWFKGFQISQLLTLSETQSKLTQQGFSNIQHRDISEQVLPSAKRLHRLGKIAFPFAYINAVLAGLLTQEPLVNPNQAMALQAQFWALKQNVWRYGFVKAVKS